MKKIFTFLFFFALSISAWSQDYTVLTVGASAWDPPELTIFVGETVEWQNTGGSHNVNGTQATFPGNPESFGNSVGAGWTYQHTFTTAGVYNYQCDPHQATMQGIITVMAAPVSALVIAGVADPQPTNGAGGNMAGPKSLELYVLEDIADLSEYGIGVANNGGGTDGVEFAFPAVSAMAGDCITLTDTNNLANFQTFFGFTPDFLVPGGGTSAVGFNGDDAIELFQNGVVVDVYGDINMDGSGTAWDHVDGWAYRLNGTGPDGSTFVESNWIYSGADALQSNANTMNSEFTNPFPNCTYNPMMSTDIVAVDDIVTVDMDVATSINVLANDMTPNGIISLTVESISLNSISVPNGTTDITYTPNMGFCGPDEIIYEICDATTCVQATVSVTVTCPTNYPAYDIGLVTADGDGDSVPDSLNVNCALTGIVYGVDLRGGDGLSFTIIGSDGEGINVFSFAEVSGYAVTEGDEIVVEGAISQFSGLTQIGPETITLNSAGNTLITPPDVTALGEGTESQLVRMAGMTLETPAQWLGDGSSFNVDITDGTNTFVMRIDDDVDLATMPAPTGLLNITGIGGQFDNTPPATEGYQLLPRYVADIEEVMVTVITALNDNVNLPMDVASNIDVLSNDVTPNGLTTLNVTVTPGNGTVSVNGTTDITYTPTAGFCGTDQFTYEICDANDCSEAIVNITIDCPISYPLYDIGLVTADGDGDGLGDSLGITCTLTGIVYGVDLLGGEGLSFTIIGSDGEGINVFNFDDISGYVVLEGDEISVQGEIIQFNGLTELQAADIVINSTFNNLITPTDVTALGEDTESQLVRMVGMTIVNDAQWLGDGSSFNVDITDGTNTFVMRIDDEVDLSSMPVPMGILNITGIGGQFDNMAPYTEGYQLLPRYLEDIEGEIATINPELSNSIKFYPNPVNELLQIDSEIELDNIRLTNVLGQLVTEIRKPAARESINVNQLQSGVYFLTFVSGGEVWSSQFVKQ